MEESYLIKAIIGGGSCMIAGGVLNPLDVVKIRMQNHSSSFPWPEKHFTKGLIRLVTQEGIQSLFFGLNATLLRECIYSTIRMGAYEPILNILNYNKKQYPSPYIKYLASLLSGGIGAAIATPTDLLKVNFQAVLPGQSLPYSTIYQGFIYIYKQNGFFGLWKGSLPTILRAAVVTSSVIGSYDTIKNNILKQHFHFQEGLYLQFICSLLAGVITTLASNPFDVVKTKYMCDTQKLYKSPTDCMIQTYHEGGIRAFYRGSIPSYWRIGPYTIICFLMMEQGRKLVGFKPI